MNYNTAQNYTSKAKQLKAICFKCLKKLQSNDKRTTTATVKTKTQTK